MSRNLNGAHYLGFIAQCYCCLSGGDVKTLSTIAVVYIMFAINNVHVRELLDCTVVSIKGL